ncbi:hypothetical protein Ait01nite_088910 [Actinoplanes italicus]|nr:hypothetical protein Ait01nite_088910 [Actinoplanes italicus]
MAEGWCCGSRPDTATLRCWTIDYCRFSGRAPGYGCLRRREGFAGHGQAINSYPAPRLAGLGPNHEGSSRVRGMSSERPEARFRYD